MEDSDVIFIGSKEGVNSNDVLPANYFEQETQRRLPPKARRSNGQHDKNNNTHINQTTAASNAAHNAQLFAGYQPPAGLHMSIFNGKALPNPFQQGTGVTTYPLNIYGISKLISSHKSAQCTVTSAAGTSNQPDLSNQVIGTVQPSHRTRLNAYREPNEPVQNAPGTSANFQAEVLHPVALVRTRKNAYRVPPKERVPRRRKIPNGVSPHNSAQSTVTSAPGTSTNFQADVLHPVAAASISALQGSQQLGRARKNAYREFNEQVHTRKNAHRKLDELVRIRKKLDKLVHKRNELAHMVHKRKNAHKEPDEPVPKRRNPPRNSKAISPAASAVKAKRAQASKVDRPTPSSKTKAKSQRGRHRKIQKVDEIPLPQPPASPETYEPIYQKLAIPEAHAFSYQQLLSLQKSHLVPSTEDTSCPVCQEWVLAGQGVILKNCLHSFCKKCLQNAILCSQMAEVKCPFANEKYSCESHLQDCEVKCLISPEDYERHLGLSVFQARCQATNVFYCMTPDCTGWCIMEEDTRHFLCSVCSCPNCIACADIHEGMTCSEFQRNSLSDRTQFGTESSTGQDYQSLLQLNDLGLVTNKEKFDCPICFCDIEVGEGVILKDCLHNYCRECLAGTIRHSETVLVKCPFVNDEYACDSFLQEREIKSLLSTEEYEKHLARSLAQVEHQSQNSFHCKTPDCAGWCLFEDTANEFFCPVCSHMNCLACAAIHEGQNCKQYQDLLEFNSDTTKDAKKTRQYLEKQIKKDLAMKCPTCQVIVMKRDGCDWLTCSMCRTEICWATKGPRWGPGGWGDTSGGCKCRLNTKPCHPKCRNCH